ncbi:hypothetical protein FQN54_001868 [Arachnomyces sp. PD_36]|nr:hypothetical protein FQN54_001868 [Arachnomyces sp. PD_36]
MPPKKRKVSFSPVEENIGSPSPTKKPRTRKAVAATAAGSRPKRGGSEDSVSKSQAKEKTSTIPPASAKRSYKKTGKVGRPKSKISSSKLSTSPVPAKRGRGRPKKVVNDEPDEPQESHSAEVETPSNSHPRKRGRPKKATKVAEPIKEDPVTDSDEEDSKEDRSYWLMKAEPETRIEKGVDVRFSIDDLRKCCEPEPWDGVRNPAETAFDTSHPYFDWKSDPNNPRWELVHVEFRRKFKSLVGLAELKTYGAPGGALENLQMLKQSRLSVSAVTAKQWKFIMGLVDEDDDGEGEAEDSGEKASPKGSINGDTLGNGNGNGNGTKTEEQVEPSG